MSVPPKVICAHESSCSGDFFFVKRGCATPSSNDVNNEISSIKIRDRN